MIDFGISPHEFRSSCFEKSLRLQKAALAERPVRWGDMEELLLRIEPRQPQVKLFYRGLVPEEKYTEEALELGVRRRRFNKIGFYSHMRHGATLVINRFEEHLLAARRLCAEVGRYAQMQTTGNAYLSFGGDGTFGKHWDTHDVFAIQLIGRKRWQVFAPTHPLPLSHQTSDGVPSDNLGAPALDCVLETGDMLYVPRGWWHQVLPLGEGSLHLSVGLYVSTVYDYILWACARQLAELACARAAFAHPADNPDTLGSIMDKLRSAVLDSNLQSQFQLDTTRHQPARSEFNLGLFLAPQIALPGLETKVCLTTCARPAVDRGEMLVNGARVRLDALGSAIVSVLAEDRALQLEALHAKLGNVPLDAVCGALLNLAGNEIVTIQEE